MWTKQNLIDEARTVADATNSNRWSPTNIARIGDAVLNREWKGILEADKLYRFSVRTPTVPSTGRIPLTDLSVDGERLFRIIAVGDELPWEKVDFIPSTIDGTSFSGNKSWYKTGSYVQLIPALAHSGVSVYVNHRPKKLSDLATGDNVEFPDGYEYILALEMGAVMLMKGGAETRESRELHDEAEGFRGEMLGEIQRPSIEPLRMIFGEPRGNYAG